mgnify:CR=1 FL=1
MKQTQQPLYPKLSSIYNKILQLASAILLIIVLMTMWQSTTVKNSVNLAEHFDYIAKQQLHQGIVATAILLKQKFNSKSQRKEILQNYLNGLSHVDFVRKVHLYDVNGALIFSSDDHLDNSTTESISDLYGITAKRRDLSEQYIPFVAEIRDESLADEALAQKKLLGYLRFTIEKSYLVDILAKADDDQQALFRLMLLLAGLVGFLLTRGLNRFSRRGYRVNALKNNDTALTEETENSLEKDK